ncbi:hypothetical protein VaNZ11_015906 [Volvox africanus]|uniref:Amino acid permease/ SLC12A domain-containing protein n=1 Tax=Volvox africanus TaxID=51714 RepID=A0ABQ5SMI7_9CHLO|nr:hypothetical protein VaNZ11_015906 [Volvox africanus]
MNKAAQGISCRRWGATVSRTTFTQTPGRRHRYGNTDTVKLLMLGYRQELAREFTLFNCLGCNLNVLSTFTALAGSYGVGMGFMYGGPVVMTWTWIVVTLLTLSVGLSLAEIASAFPTSGALYYWSYRLAPASVRNLTCFLTAWVLTMGQAALSASATYTFVQLVEALVEQQYGVSLSPGCRLGILLATLVALAALNCGSARMTAFITTIGAFWHLIALFGFCFALLLMAPKRQSVKYIFTSWQPDTSTSGITSPLYNVMMGMLMTVWTFTGYDGAAHVSEETLDAEHTVPTAILLSISGAGIAGFILMTTLIVVKADDSITFDPSGHSNMVLEMLKQMLDKVPSQFRSSGALFSIPVVAAFFCSFQAVANNSRMLYAFARDGGVPLHQWARRVHPRTHAPLGSTAYMVTIAAALSIPMCFNALVLSLVTSFAAIACYSAYVVPVICKLVTGRRNFIPGPFKLPPRLSIANNIVTAVWVCAVLVIFTLPGFFPVVLENCNWSGPMMLGVVLLLVAWYHLPVYGAKGWFRGPRPNLGQFQDVLPSDAVRAARNKPLTDNAPSDQQQQHQQQRLTELTEAMEEEEEEAAASVAAAAAATAAGVAVAADASRGGAVATDLVALAVGRDGNDLLKGEPTNHSRARSCRASSSRSRWDCDAEGGGGASSAAAVIADVMKDECRFGRLRSGNATADLVGPDVSGRRALRYSGSCADGTSGYGIRDGGGGSANGGGGGGGGGENCGEFPLSLSVACGGRIGDTVAVAFSMGDSGGGSGAVLRVPGGAVGCTGMPKPQAPRQDAATETGLGPLGGGGGGSFGGFVSGSNTWRTADQPGSPGTHTRGDEHMRQATTTTATTTTTGWGGFSWNDYARPGLITGSCRSMVVGLGTVSARSSTPGGTTFTLIRQTVQHASSNMAPTDVPPYNRDRRSNPLAYVRAARQRLGWFGGGGRLVRRLSSNSQSGWLAVMPSPSPSLVSVPGFNPLRAELVRAAVGGGGGGGGGDGDGGGGTAAAGEDSSASTGHHLHSFGLAATSTNSLGGLRYHINHYINHSRPHLMSTSRHWDPEQLDRGREHEHMSGPEPQLLALAHQQRRRSGVSSSGGHPSGACAFATAADVRMLAERRAAAAAAAAAATAATATTTSVGGNVLNVCTETCMSPRRSLSRRPTGSAGVMTLLPLPATGASHSVGGTGGSTAAVSSTGVLSLLQLAAGYSSCTSGYEVTGPADSQL